MIMVPFPTYCVIPKEVKSHKYFNEWLEFHSNNKDVIRRIVLDIRAAKAKGRTRVSIKTILGVIRYEKESQIVGDGEFRINDKFTSIYGNIIAATFPDLSSMIETRKLRAQKM